MNNNFNRAFQAIWVFYFLSFIVSYALLPVVPLHLRELGATVKESGRFTTAFMVGSGLGALFTGPLGDYWGQRAVLKWATITAAACFAIYAFLGHVWLFFLVGIPHGVIWSGYRTATLSWVGGFLPEERRAEGFAIFGMAAPGGAALGPIVGIWLMPHVGFSNTMLILAVASASLLFVLGYLPASHAIQSTSPSSVPSPAPAIVAVGEKRVIGWLIAPMVILACLAISYGPIPSYGAQEAKDFGFVWASALVSCYGLGMVLLRLILGICGMGKNPLRLMPLMLAINVIAALGLALLPGGLLRHIVCGVVFGASFGMAHTLTWTYVMGRAESQKRGAVTGALYCAYDTGIGLGSFLIGFPMEYLGYRWGWGIGALFLCVAWVIALKALPKGEIQTLKVETQRLTGD